MIDKKILSWLTTCPASDLNFVYKLKEADIETMQQALKDKSLSKTAIKKIESEIKRKDYPEEMTTKKADKFSIFKTFFDSDTIKEDYQKACAFAKKINGQIYTAIDGENNKTYYWKGLHYVNRFGFIVVGWDSK